MNNDTPSRKMAPVCFAQNRAAAGGQDDALLLCQLIDHCRLSVPETFFTLHIEYPGDFCPGAILDFVVRVEKRHLLPHARVPGEAAPEGSGVTVANPGATLNGLMEVVEDLVLRPAAEHEGHIATLPQSQTHT